MGILNKLFGKKEEKKEEETEETPTTKINPNAPLYNNELFCNSCGQQINNTPRFLNLHGRKMVFHKRCLKRLKQGNVQL